MCAVRVGLFTAVSYEYWLMAVVVGFHCDKEPAKLRSSPGKRPLSRRLVSSVKCIWRSNVFDVDVIDICIIVNINLYRRIYTTRWIRWKCSRRRASTPASSVYRAAACGTMRHAAATATQHSASCGHGTVSWWRVDAVGWAAGKTPGL